MKRNVETVIKRIREELRAEGADGAGFSDFIIVDAINSALDDLSDTFTVRDLLDFNTTTENTYNLRTVVDAEIYTLLRVSYDGKVIDSVQIDDYLSMVNPEEGPVRQWFLWGDHLTLVGNVEGNKEVKMWVLRAPAHIDPHTPTMVPDTPRHADEAIISFAMSICYRESREYERANYHYGIFLRQKENLLRRSVPQGQGDHNPQMRSIYWGTFRPSSAGGWTPPAWTDTNPGGNP